MPSHLLSLLLDHLTILKDFKSLPFFILYKKKIINLCFMKIKNNNKMNNNRQFKTENVKNSSHLSIIDREESSLKDIIIIVRVDYTLKDNCKDGSLFLNAIAQPEELAVLNLLYRVCSSGLLMVSETMKLRLHLKVIVESFNLVCCLAIGLQVKRVKRIHGVS